MGYSYGFLAKWLGSCGNNKGSMQQRETRLWFSSTSFSTADMGNFLTALLSHTNAAHTAAELLTRYDYTTVRPTDVNLDVKARFCLKDNSDGTIHRFELPAPKDSIFENQGVGERVKASVLSSIETAIETYLHRDVTMLWGKKIQRG